MRTIALPFFFAVAATAKPIASSIVPSSHNVIVQLFEWNWDSIAAECASFLGPAGYGYVQVSPPQEHLSGDQWWTDYQGVSYNVVSKRGNRDQFQNMVNRCHSAGVGVIADVLFNHMAGVDSGTGVTGSSFTHYVYPGTYQYQDFHHCGLEPNDAIVNWNSQQEIWTCQLENLADLATDTEYVRWRLAEFGNDLISLGVDGFRIDAAKHIAVVDLANITSRLSKQLYFTQEVVYGAGQPVQPSMYTGIVQRFRFASALESAFSSSSSSGIAALKNLDSQGWLSSSSANTFVSNQDTERSGGSLNYKASNNAYTLAEVFSLLVFSAHPYGTHTVLSSYSFSSNDAGGPNGGAGTCNGNSGSNGWLCQHRWTAIAGMVGFRNVAGSASLSDWTSPSAQRIAFGRGSNGFVVINNSGSSWSATFSTSLADGTYCDVIHGSVSSGSCSGNTYTVSSRSFKATVASSSFSSSSGSGSSSSASANIS
ncbi:glycoside hydrolase family 13 protein [Vararia minispora EC-137]|uniref:Glycoside hydrolase family 13 protein n=1 Tax=Vararia minispora EC-137 TaxID=1314806 RepID=A0ACB8QHA2_9AGAM|nr:glycoside hydrolase family 13 protein [Vararia minispora EC-137]